MYLSSVGCLKHALIGLPKQKHELVGERDTL